MYLGSADWMSRNLVRRVEVVFPIEDPALRERITTQILAAQLADNTKAWELLPDGAYAPITPPEGVPKRDSQAEFMALALGDAKTTRKRTRVQRPKPKLQGRNGR